MKPIKLKVLGCNDDKISVVMSKEDLISMLFKKCDVVDSTVSNTQFNKILFHADKLDERKKINCVFIKRENGDKKNDTK